MAIMITDTILLNITQRTVMERMVTTRVNTVTIMEPIMATKTTGPIPTTVLTGTRNMTTTQLMLVIMDIMAIMIMGMVMDCGQGTEGMATRSIMRTIRN